VICLGGFTVVYNVLVLIPLIPPIAADFEVSVALAGLTITAPALLGAAGALWAGPAIDRIGSRPLILGGLWCLTAATAASAVAPGFAALVLVRGVVGLGTAGVTPGMLALIARHFGYQERGRAVGWYFAATTVGPILGLPVASAIAGAASWRWTFVLLTGIALATAILFQWKLPAEAAVSTGAPGRAASSLVLVLRNRPAMLATLWNTLGGVYWMVILTYLGAFFHHQHGVPTGALGLLNTVSSLGFLFGSLGGGRLADRFSKRAVVLAGGLVSTGFGWLLTAGAAGLPAALACLLLFAIPNGARNTSGQALLTEMLPGVRGTLLSLAAAGGQLGVVLGSVLGGWVIESLGYGWLGPVSAAVCLAATALFWAGVPEHAVDAPDGAGAPRPTS